MTLAFVLCFSESSASSLGFNGRRADTTLGQKYLVDNYGSRGQTQLRNDYRSHAVVPVVSTASENGNNPIFAHYGYIVDNPGRGLAAP